MEPTTPNSAATEHANEDNTGPRGSDATERAAIHTPHATTVVTCGYASRARTPSTCYLCKGPGNVEARQCRDDRNLQNAGTIEIGSTTWFMHVNMFRQTYIYAAQVCHNCYEARPYTTQEQLRLDALLEGDAKLMAALLHAIFFAVPSNAARKITDYLFPTVAISE